MMAGAGKAKRKIPLFSLHVHGADNLFTLAPVHNLEIRRAPSTHLAKREKERRCAWIIHGLAAVRRRGSAPSPTLAYSVGLREAAHATRVAHIEKYRGAYMRLIGAHRASEVV